MSDKQLEKKSGTGFKNFAHRRVVMKLVDWLWLFFFRSISPYPNSDHFDGSVRSATTHYSNLYFITGIARLLINGV